VYMNISLREVTNIIKIILNNNQILTEEKHKLITSPNKILEQNYLQFNNQYYKQNDGLAMGNHSWNIHPTLRTYKNYRNPEGTPHDRLVPICR
jgi:hypothetical protein